MEREYIYRIEEERPETRELVRELTLMDDLFFSALVNGNTSFLQLVLDVILEGRAKERVTAVHTQHQVSSLNKDVIYDAYGETEGGAKVILEVQNKPQEFPPQRMRFYLSALDASILRRGESYRQLPDVYFFLIMPADFFGQGKAVYYVPDELEEDGMKIRDGVLRIFIDSRRADEDTALGRFLHDLNSSDPQKMYYTENRKMFSEFRSNGGEEKMTERLEREFERREAAGLSRGMAEGRAEGMEKGRAEGEARGKTENLVSNLRTLMNKFTLTPEAAMDMLDVPSSERPQLFAAL